MRLLQLKDVPEYANDLKELLREYGNYMYDELKLIAGKETFYDDLKDIPGKKYSPPEGTFILALEGQEVIGCSGIKKYQDTECEMKRMFIKKNHRGKGIGKALCLEVFKIAKEMNFSKILLDSNKEMAEAVNLYLSVGFQNIPPYCINENDNPVYMEYKIP